MNRMTGLSLSLREARRIALAAQGFGNIRSEGPASRRGLDAMAEGLGALQIDSVNVLARAHLLPGFSRLGRYDIADLHALSYGGNGGKGERNKGRAFFEYWAHEASLLPLDLFPLFRWRMERAARGEGIYNGLARFGRAQRPLIDRILAEVKDRGPLSAGEFSTGEKGGGGWWGWSDTKHAVEWLFWAGELTTATRRGTFERVYDLPERALPKEIVEAPVPAEADAIRALMLRAAKAVGVGTERCLRDYYRLGVADAKRALAELVESGDLLPVTVEGWKSAAYLGKDVAQPRRMTARALLAPFDPLIWQRERTEALFGARIRLEIYTPAHKREHGYYVLPFLLGDGIVARVDLKADRAGKALLVQSAHLETGAKAADVVEPLRSELRLMADWLGLESVTISGKGGLAKALDHADVTSGTAAL
jgi:uncharacterized protein